MRTQNTELRIYVFDFFDFQRKLIMHAGIARIAVYFRNARTCHRARMLEVTIIRFLRRMMVTSATGQSGYSHFGQNFAISASFYFVSENLIHISNNAMLLVLVEFGFLIIIHVEFISFDSFY